LNICNSSKKKKNMATQYKVHPALGIGRVGNSNDYYIAPSTPGGLPTEYSTQPPSGTYFRDAQSQLLRQAVKFQVYVYDSANPDGAPIAIGQNNIVGIKWTVWVANKKSCWFQFQQHTGSKMGPYDGQAQIAGYPYAHQNDVGYEANNTNNPWDSTTQKASNPNAPSNPLRYNKYLCTTPDPTTIADAGRQNLILDPGPRSISTVNKSLDFDLDTTTYAFLTQLNPFPISTLGSMQTDADFNLTVLPGFGNSGTTDCEPGVGPRIMQYANNHGWFDDIADGPVIAELIMKDGSKVPVDANGWFSVAPPKYAPEAINMVTMYDNIYDVYVRELNYKPSLYSGGKFLTSYLPNYLDEIKPILDRPDVYQWLCDMPTVGKTNHTEILTDTSAEFKALPYKYLRGRGIQNGSPGPSQNLPSLMPQLAGDNPLSNYTISKYLGLTETQFFILQQFANGDFVRTAPVPASTDPGPALDKAALDNCVGGPFVPGIEITWISRNTTIYTPLSASPDASELFRINAADIKGLTPGSLSLTNGQNNDYTTGVEPGDLSKYMAQPWQADFNECSVQNINTQADSLNTPINNTNMVIYWWWPVQRPYRVFPAAATDTQVPWTRGYSTVQTPAVGADSDLQMVTCWKDLGFIKKKDNPAAGEPLFQEIERLDANITAYTRPGPPCIPGQPCPDSSHATALTATNTSIQYPKIQLDMKNKN
jgi:hypothetical protein